MKLSIDSNIPEFAELMRRKRELVPVVVKKAVIDGTTELFQISRSLMVSMIYAKPIPKILRNKRLIKTGPNQGQWKKFKTPQLVDAWRRTNELLRRERFWFRGSGADTTGVIDNSVPYAQPRHDLNRPSPIDGVIRRAPWRTQARAQGMPVVKRIFREGLDAGLGSP